MLKIAVIGPGQSLDAIRQALEIQPFDCQFLYYAYKRPEDILDIYNASFADWDAIIFSGELGYMYFKDHTQQADLPLSYLEVDTQYFFGQLLKYLTESPGATLERVYVDFISETNNYLGLDQYIDKSLMPIMPKALVYDSTMYQVTLGEILTLWKSQQIDVVFTRITNNIPNFEALGIPYIHIYPPAAAIRDAVKRAVDEVMLHHLSNNQLAVGHIDLLLDDQTKADFRLVEYLEITMYKHLVDFRMIHQMNYSILKLSGVYEITFSRVEIGSSQDHYAFPLLNYLSEHYPENFNMGIGIGSSVEEGRFHAIEALAEARHFGVRHGFMVDQNNRIWGPIGNPNCIEYRPLPSQSEILSKQLNISPKNLERLLAYSTTTPYLTSDQVAEALNITVRSANRILSRLAADGFLAIINSEEPGGVGGNETNTGAGRPVKRYVVNKGKIDVLRG